MATISVPAVLRQAESSPDLSALPQFYLSYEILPASYLVQVIDVFSGIHKEMLGAAHEGSPSKDLTVAALKTGGSVLGAFWSQLPAFGAIVQGAYISILGTASAFYFVYRQKVDVEKAKADTSEALAKAEESRANADLLRAEAASKRKEAYDSRVAVFGKQHDELQVNARNRFASIEERRRQLDESQVLAISDGVAVVLSGKLDDGEYREYLDYVYEEFHKWLYDMRFETSLDMSNYVTLWLEARGFEFLKNVWGLYLKFVNLLQSKGFLVTSVLSHQDYNQLYRLQRIRR